MTAFAQRLKDSVKNRPPVFDFFIHRGKRQLLRRRNPAFDFLDGYSRLRGPGLTFIQIGANDGLRNDPVREFVVRDAWRGVLIEPLPTVFAELQRNYEYLRPRRQLAFENVAISAEIESLPFFTFRPEMLAMLPAEKRLDLLRKSSFERAHVAQFAGDPGDIVQVDVPCRSVAQIIARHFPENALDLLVIDAEGHESTILRSIDFAATPIGAVFFESRHLGAEREPLLQLLTTAGYRVKEAGEDAFATRFSAAEK